MTGQQPRPPRPRRRPRRRSLAIAVGAALAVTTALVICIVELDGGMDSRGWMIPPEGVVSAREGAETAGARAVARPGAALRDAPAAEITSSASSGAVRARLPDTRGASTAIDRNPVSTASGTRGRVVAATELIELALSGVAAIEGTAGMADGTPVSECEVRLTTTDSETIGSARTDPDGGFRFDDLAPGGGYRLRVTPPAGLEEEVVALALEPGTRHVDIVLREKGAVRLSLLLLDTDGEPLSNRILAARSPASAEGTRGVTDSEGRIVLDEVPSGSLVIESSDPPELTVSGLVARPGEELDVVVIGALGGHAVEGIVVDEGGAALVGVHVTAVWSQRDDGIRSGVVRTVRTDGAGRFTVHGLGAGIFELSAVAAGYQRAGKTVEVPADSEARLELPPIR